MRKLFTLLAFVATISTWAARFEVDGIYYSTLDESSVEVTYQKRLSSSNYASLTTAVIPNTVVHDGTTYAVTAIGVNAFFKCTALQSITIGNNVTTIKDRGIAGCNILSSILIGRGVTSIAETNFSDCDSITSIIVDSGNTMYDSRNNCNAIIETTTNKLLLGCNNTVIPNTVEIIGVRALYNCKKITSIDIPNSVKTIESQAFCQCSNLKNVSFGNGLDSIGTGAFKECNILNNIHLPNSLQKIGDAAFYNCYCVNSLSIGDGLKSIGDSAFYKISSFLTSITVGDGNSIYDSRNNCNALIHTATNTLLIGCENTVIPNGVEVIGASAFYNSHLPSIDIPNTVKIIENSAFYLCGNLQSIVIPNSVEEISWNAFYLCYSLSSAEFGDGITTIGNQAFMYTSLKDVVLGKSVRTIASEAFYGCNLLETIDLPIGLEEIGYRAFSYCTALRSFTIPKSVKKIGYYAFYNTVVYNDVSNWENDVLYLDNCLIKAENISGEYAIKQGTRVIADEALVRLDNLTTVTIPMGVESIGEQAFFGCYSLESFNIPSSVTRIGNAAFQATGVYEDKANWENGSLYHDNCLLHGYDSGYSSISITEYSIKQGTRLIADWAFSSCSKLSSLYIPASVSHIGYYAFYGCSSLLSVTCEAVTPPILEEYVFHRFSGVPTSAATLYVPKQSIQSYKSVEQWKEFATILPIEQSPNAVENIEIPKQPNKIIRDGQMLIEQNGKFYNLLGNIL